MIAYFDLKQFGFTIVELMVALAINTLIFGALIAIFLTNINHYRKSLNTMRLHQQLQSALDVMSSEIRRTGYWGNANSDVGLAQNNNPFMATGVDISTPTTSCILFAYDQNNNGTLPSIGSLSDDERYGFRLSGQAIQIRPPGAVFACNAPATAWEDLTDPNLIQITNLIFTLNTITITTGPGTKGVAIRNVDITLTGQLTSDSSITKTLTQHVRIQNDKFLP